MCFTNVNEVGIRYRYFMYSTNKCTDFNKNITNKKKKKKKEEWSLVGVSNESFLSYKIQNMTGTISITIQKFLKQMRERGNIENLTRSGGRRKTTPQVDRILFRSVKINRRKTLKDATARFNQRTGCNVSSRTVCRRLFWEGYNRRVVSKKITISQVNRQRRVGFCCRKLHWTVDQWSL